MEPSIGADRAKDALDWIREETQGNAPATIPPPLIAGALAWASHKSNNDESIRELRQFSSPDTTLITQFVVQQVEKRVFNIENDSEGKELAKLFMEDKLLDPEMIKSDEIRYKLALLCAKFYPIEMIQWMILSFNLKDNERFEIAKICAQLKGASTTQYIHNFKITKEADLRMIYAIAFVNSRDALKSLPVPRLQKDPAFWSLLNLADSIREDKSPVPKDKLLELFKGQFGNELNDILRSDVDNAKLLWFIGIVYLFSQDATMNLIWTQENGILRALANVQRSDLRDRLTRIFVRFSKDTTISPPSSHAKWDPKASWKMVTGLLYMDLEKQGVDKSVIDQIRIATEKKDSKYQVYTGYNALIDMLLSLSESQNLDVKSKETILKKLLPNVAQENVNAVNVVLLINQPERLFKQESAQEVVINIVKDELSLGQIEEFQEKYSRTFGTMRSAMLLPIYTAKLSRFNDPVAINSFKDFVTQILTGSYMHERYNVENSSHMQQLVSHDKEIVTKWRTNLTGEVGADASTQKAQERINAKDWLKAKLQEGHLPIMDDWDVNYIQRYLAGDITAKEELTAAMKSRKTHVKQGMFDPLRFQLTLIEYAESDDKSVKETIAILNRLEKSVKGINQPAFLKDLKEQIEMISNTEVPKVKEGLMVFESDDPDDLIMFGSEVYGSCQALEADPLLSRGVLGNLFNPWNKVLKVSMGKNDPMIARCKLQLLWDGEKPVLFRERFYSKGPLSEQHKMALNELARKKAKELGVPLLSKDEGAPYGKPLMALGGLAPYEYSDAAAFNELKRDGHYTIADARYL